MVTTKAEIMVAPRKPKSEESPPATVPTGSSAAFGNVDHSFTLQAIMDLKGSMGELKSSVELLKSSVDGMESKVGELVTWRHRILGGVIVLGVIFAFLGFVFGKFSDYVTIKAPTDQVQPNTSQASTKPVNPKSQ